MCNSTKHLHEIKADGIDLTDGPEADDIENLDEPNNLNINVFEQNEDKTNSITRIKKSHVDDQMDSHENIHEAEDI